MADCEVEEEEEEGGEEEFSGIGEKESLPKERRNDCDRMPGYHYFLKKNQPIANKANLMEKNMRIDPSKRISR